MNCECAVLFFIRMQDIWTGLFSRNPKMAADVWEAKCLAHPDRLILWGANEPDNIGRHLCARYKLTTGKLHTRSCGDSLSVVCEFDAGTSVMDACPHH